MTAYPEGYLARELELCYANVSMVTDHDVGVEGTCGVRGQGRQVGHRQGSAVGGGAARPQEVAPAPRDGAVSVRDADGDSAAKSFRLTLRRR